MINMTYDVILGVRYTFNDVVPSDINSTRINEKLIRKQISNTRQNRIDRAYRKITKQK